MPNEFIGVTFLVLGLIIFFQFFELKRRKEEMVLQKNIIDELRSTVDEISASQQQARQSQLNAEKEYEKSLLYASEIETLLKEKSYFFPSLALAFADLQKLRDDREVWHLQTKKRPAHKAADKVREYSAKARAAEIEFRMLKYQLDFYERYFPWITEVSGSNLEELLNSLQSTETASAKEEGKDPVCKHLSDAEFASLSVTERNQLALDRWNKNRKSNWEIGRIYERYIGYKYEQRGYDVEYYGAIKGLDDLGRDLITKKDNMTKLVQCKYWSQDKTIHEKHIFQLFGSVIEYIVRNDGADSVSTSSNIFERIADITPVFVTSTTLSDRAREFAEILNVEIFENIRLGEYPLIKCNIAKSSGERVYHLPMDQQYDRTKIEPLTGEFYAKTVLEAEHRGFRRAHRWQQT